MPETGVDRWFALRVQGNRENIVSTILLKKGFESFLPTYKWRAERRSRRRQLESPLFPGYVFCRFDVFRRLPILTTPGVLHVVGIGSVPVPIDDVEIDSIRKTMQESLQAHPSTFLHVGQRVRIVEGALSGVEGILTGFKNKFHLTLSITLLRRSVRIEIDRDWVTACVPCGSHQVGQIGGKIVCREEQRCDFLV